MEPVVTGSTDRHREKPLSLRLGPLREQVEARAAELGVPVRRFILNAIETFTRDVPEGSQVSGPREEVLAARTWVQIDADGTQIYLDVDENVRVLVRTVGPAPA